MRGFYSKITVADLCMKHSFACNGKITITLMAMMASSRGSIITPYWSTLFQWSQRVPQKASSPNLWASFSGYPFNNFSTGLDIHPFHVLLYLQVIISITAFPASLPGSLLVSKRIFSWIYLTQPFCIHLLRYSKHPSLITFLKMPPFSPSISPPRSIKKSNLCDAGLTFLCLVCTLDAHLFNSSATHFAFCSHSYRLRPECEGFSHGLKKCPPDTFLPSLRSGRPFKSFPHLRQ